MKKTDPKIEREIVDKYSGGIGTLKLSSTYKIHRSTIQAILIRNGIKLRSTSPYYHYNVNFFSTYTKESCYWGGFVAADGYIRKSRTNV